MRMDEFGWRCWATGETLALAFGLEWTSWNGQIALGSFTLLLLLCYAILCEEMLIFFFFMLFFHRLKVCVPSTKY